MFGVSRFKGRVAVIAGAEHPLAYSLARRLAGFGTTVVAIGLDNDALMALAQTAPARIEPLTLRTGRRDVLMLLKESWQDEAIDIYMDFMLLIDSARSESNANTFARSAGLGAALGAGLRNGEAMAVVGIPQVTDTSSVEAQAQQAGYAALVRRFSRECGPARFVGLSLPNRRKTWSDADCLSAGDMALMLCHPVSRGVSPGSVVDWVPHPA